MDFVTAAIAGRFDLSSVETFDGIATSLVTGDVDAVSSWLADHRVDESLPPLGWQPIEYVAYSQYFQSQPDALNSLTLTAKLLLERGADPSACHQEGQWKLPVLYGATGHSGNAAVAELLLEAGADPDDNESVYHAAQFNRREILELLKRYGANLSGSFDEWGNTPLYFNCGHLPGGNGSSSAMKGVEWLLQNGANPNIPSYDCQETPLHLVSKNGWGSDVIRMFLEAGANPDLVDAQGWRAIDWATWVGNSPAMEVLREVGQEVNSSIPNWYVEAAQGNLPENAKLQDISEPMQGQVLRKLAETGNVRGMNVLLQLGFSARSADDKGVTPLHWACYRGNSAQVRLLLAAGADWRTQEANYDGTPMDWAVHGMTFQPSSPSSYPDVIDALILEGASTAPIERMAANPDLTESQRRRLEAFLS